MEDWRKHSGAKLCCLFIDGLGKVVGFYNRAVETTDNVVRQRRSKTLYAVLRFDSRFDYLNLWAQLFLALRGSPQGFPIAFAYSADDDGDNCRLTLEQGMRLPASGHSLVLTYMDIMEGSIGFPSCYRKLKAINELIILH